MEMSKMDAAVLIADAIDNERVLLEQRVTALEGALKNEEAPRTREMIIIGHAFARQMAVNEALLDYIEHTSMAGALAAALRDALEKN